MDKKEKPTSITLIGRRWFRRGPGGTYHTCQIMINGKTVATTAEQYGYGDTYEQSGWEWLEANGFAELERYGNSSKEAPFRYCERLGIAYERSAIDVARERDL